MMLHNIHEQRHTRATGQQTPPPKRSLLTISQLVLNLLQSNLLAPSHLLYVSSFRSPPITHEHVSLPLQGWKRCA